MSILIVCYGNPLRGDDGFGWHAADRLRTAIQDPSVEIRTMHQLVPELMDSLSRVDRAIFIDASVGPVPGEIRERTLEPAAGGATFTHHVTPAALLAGSKALYGKAPLATLITVTGADFSLSDRLSPAIGTALSAVVQMALRMI